MSDSLSGVTCETHMALRWERAEGEGDAAFASMAALNEDRLRIINGIDEYQAESEEDMLEIAVQLQRLEFKVNLALDMLSELLLGRANVPQPMPVSLSLSRLSWQGNPLPGVGELLRVEVYLHRRYPFPIVLTGRVEKLIGDQVELLLDPQPESVRILLEKFIFRCHRRQIARLRQKI
ncbi:MAG: PilZ domain-containing protein [Gammaproteobacteria bacterium]|nr:PilZ domain-containing protein [Gammaproteobacteria bacterium]